MALKTIKFRLNADGSANLADGTNGIVLATGSTYGAYPQTLSGITCGWSPDNAGAISAAGTLGVAPFDYNNVIVPSAATTRLLRIDRTAGTFVIKLQTAMPDPTYASTALRVLQSDGITVAFAQTVTDVTSASLGSKQINTNGTLQAVGTADAGQSITTTGAYFYVQWFATGTYATRLAYIQFDDGVAGGGTSAALFRRRYS